MKALKFLPVALMASAVLVGCTGAGASAKVSAKPSVSPSAKSASKCSGGDLSGTYSSGLTITGVCYIPNGNSVTVDGNLTVAKGAMLDAISPGGTGVLGTALPGNLDVTGSIKVSSGAALLLGWCTEPDQGYGYENCDSSKLGSSDDSVGGNITSSGALAVIVHNVDVSGGITLSGGGGGDNCTKPALFTQDTDPAVNGSVSIGYDFLALNYSDLESNTVSKNVSVTGLKSCYFGGLRDDVAGNFVFSHDTTSNADSNEVIGNEIHHNVSCVGDSPAVQFGDSGSGPNVVSDKASGQCGFDVMKWDEDYEGGVTIAISVKS